MAAAALVLAASMLFLQHDAAAYAEAEPCEAVLVTHSPDSSTGSTEAVSITAQAFERDVDGWVNVAWQAGPATQLTALTITATDGTVTTRTDDLEAGAAVDVAELRFCGSTQAAPPDGSDTDDAAAEDPAAEDDDSEAEVLGVRLTRDDDLGGGRTVLIGLGILLGLVAFTGGAALWVRREPA